MSAPPAPAPGLVHAAVIGTEPEEIVARCLPELRRVASAGGELGVYADRRHSRLLREGLPDTTMRFTSPVDLDSRGLVHRLADDRGLAAVIGTACSDTVAAEGHDEGVLAEDAVTLLLAHLPLTVICLYDPADPVGMQVAHRTHPWLLTEEGRVVNTGYRPPAASSPVPGAVVGPALLEVAVPDGTLLSGLRSQIADRARTEGLGPDQVEDTVLVAHEALLVAGGARLAAGTPADLPSGDHQLLLRRARYGIVAECHGTPPAGEGREGQDDRLVALRDLADGLTVHDHGDGRLVRVLVRRP